MNNSEYINDTYIRKMGTALVHEINSCFICTVGIKNNILLNLGLEVIKNIPVERIKKKVNSYGFGKAK
jgi:hypothetical protein